MITYGWTQCTFKLFILKKALWQILHLKGFSPVWSMRCWSNSTSFVKSFPQNLQIKISSLIFSTVDKSIQILFPRTLSGGIALTKEGWLSDNFGINARVTKYWLFFEMKIIIHDLNFWKFSRKFENLKPWYFSIW